ncbi:MAG TPA: hypothetical protein VFS14_03280 [Candidatus Saccharimonadales bacterium]|nr:hypothetical protein [Candidatus Saccharimonadales bacterium]
MSDVQEEDKQLLFTPMDASRLVGVLLLGAVIGLLVWGLSLTIDRYVLTPTLCQAGQIAQCGNTAVYAEDIAAVIGAAVGLFFLVRLQVYRPLLVVIAVVVSLWGILGQVALLPWYGIGLAAIALYAFAYGLFAWVARFRSFWMVVILYVVLVAAVRVAFSF